MADDRALAFSSDIALDAKGPFVIVGDTQKTLLAERLLLRREVNLRETVRIVKSIASENPGFIIHLGDMVANGSSQRHWRFFDSVFEEIRKREIPVLPALGNHDYWGLTNLALKRARERFSQMAQKSWYMRIYKGLAMIWLDSNQVIMGFKLWLEQAGWFAQTLLQLDGDDSVKGIVVFVHHPPFTNSERNKDAWWVRRSFVDPFSATGKGLAMFSGHSHGYERFLIDGKFYVVSGGGGGPRVTYCEADMSRHTDVFQAPAPRPFNYIVGDVDDGGVKFIVKGLRKGEAEVGLLEEFNCRFPK